MKALCAISSVQFNIEHFPGELFSREISHPVFYLSQKKLLSYLGKWASNGLTPTDSYLLFLALLNTSELVHFRVPVYRNDKTDSIVANNMEYLAKTLLKLNTVYTPSFSFPQFAITPDTRFLTNIYHWIEAWDDAYKAFHTGKIRDIDDRALVKKEVALSRLIKTYHRSPSKYATSLAEWGAASGNFPTFNVLNPFNSNKTYISCADYWKIIIYKCAFSESIYSVSQRDILDILEHCEHNIPIGTIQSNALFTLLRHAVEKQKNFLGLGDIDLSNGTYSFVSQEDTVESANIQAMIQAAPASEPVLKEYPSKMAYLRAKMRWEMARIAAVDKPIGTINGDEDA